MRYCSSLYLDSTVFEFLFPIFDMQMIQEYTESFSEETFAEFLKHMRSLANEYRMSAQMESIRYL